MNFSKESMESYLTSTHFCSAYGEVTLQCQYLTFMNGSDYGELSHEISFAYHSFGIILYCSY